MPSVSLTVEEALALIVLVQSTTDDEQIPFLRPASRAVEKVRAQMPAKVQDQIGDLDQHVAMQPARTGSADG